MVPTLQAAPEVTPPADLWVGLSTVERERAERLLSAHLTCTIRSRSLLGIADPPIYSTKGGSGTLAEFLGCD
jgi:hypothetical protein